MNALGLLIPRPVSTTDERADEEEFQLLIESIQTLLFTTTEHHCACDAAIVAAALAELRARWPEMAVERAPRVTPRRRGRHAS